MGKSSRPQEPQDAAKAVGEGRGASVRLYNPEGKEQML